MDEEARVNSEVVLEARGITKHFPGILANDHIDFDLRKGEIHALLGENGAGKTTLMNILYGLYQPDAGELYVKGRRFTTHHPSESIRAGIGMVHQHFMLVPVFTVAENIMLGAEISRYGIVNHRYAEEKIRRLSKEYGLAVEPTALVKDLPVGVQQRVEIVKALYRQADILILDEPTAVLTPQEVEELFIVMRRLVERGKSIVFITHKLKEVMAVVDRITVLRRGRVVGSTVPAKTDEMQLAEMMVGRKVILQVEKGLAHPGQLVLQVEDLVVEDDRGATVVDHLSLEVCSGEILGIAGVQGNGQTELVEALSGLREAVSGQVIFGDQDMTRKSPRRRIETGLSHIPEDRRKHGLVLTFPVADNLMLCTYYKPPFAKGIVLQEAIIEEQAQKLVQQFDIRTPSIFVPTEKLSGGNQQKVIVAREFSRPVTLLLASQPTRGLDVGSIEYIHQKVIEMRDEGAAVLLVSAELDEIMALSDRIAVMYKGKIVATMTAAAATREELGLLMAGGTVAGEEAPPTAINA